ncbi:MAG: spermidine synthase [Frankia sp.]
MSARRAGEPPITTTPTAQDAGPPPAAELVADPDRPGAWTLLVDGTPQSYVDLGDPTNLAFDYIRRLGYLVDLAAPAGAPQHVLHLGGGALTLARYVAASRPGSRQRVFEIDPALTELVRAKLPLDRAARGRVRVRAIDAREGLAAVPDGAADLILVDVFAGARTPAHLTTVEFVTDAARALRPGGVLAANVADGPPLAFVRAQVATVRAVFANAVMLAEPGVLRGRRFGNVVLAASNAPLAVAALTRRAAGDPAPARVVADADLAAFAGSARPVTDNTAQPSPSPPPSLFARRG